MAIVMGTARQVVNSDRSDSQFLSTITQPALRSRIASSLKLAGDAVTKQRADIVAIDRKRAELGLEPFNPVLAADHSRD